MRRLALAFVLAVALGAAAHAARGEQKVPSTGILAIGDFGVGGETERSVGTAMRQFSEQNPTSLLLTLGDNDYTESPERFREDWSASFGWAKDSGVPVAGTLGNHDILVDNGRYEFQTLSMPGAFYRRQLPLVDLFILNSNNVSLAQTRWLARVLAASKATWKIAAFHHPAYTCAGYRSHSLVVHRWVPLFQRYGVQLVLSGHDHNYQRFRVRRGVTYVVHGGGGRGFYPIVGCPRGYPRRVRARMELGWLYLDVRAKRLYGYSVSLDGRRTDTFTLLP